MKTSLKSLVALAAFAATALISQAQTPKIHVVDMGKVLDGYYRTQEQQEKFKGYQDKAREEDERLFKEGKALADQYKEVAEQTKNPTLTADARTAAQAEAQKKLEEVQKKELEINNYRQETQRMLQQQFNAARGLLIEEIAKAATEIAKKKGATILFDKGSLVYFEPAYDISDEVLAEMNKGRPAGSAAPAASSSTPAAPKDGPAVSFPGAKK